MERTESNIIQVAPDYENNKIQEQEVFGWSLHGRQEIHQEGLAVGGPDFLGDGYTIKTKVNMFVKLHFVRSRELPNIDRIRELENEYNSLERPEYPTFIPGGFLLLIFWTLPWLTLYVPFGYFRKKQKADGQSLLLRAKYDEVSQEIAALG